MGFSKKEIACMKIVIDGRFWSESGLGRYIRNLVNELQKVDFQNDYDVLFLKKDFDNITFHCKNFHKVLADFKWYEVGEQIKLPKLLNNLQPDLVHFPHFNTPIFYRGKYIVTIHDLIHQHFQARQTTNLNPFFHAIKKMGYKKVFSSAIKNSEKIIVPSEFIKKQLIKEWKIKEEKIVVTYEGVSEKLIEDLDTIKEFDFEKAAEKFNIKTPYLFYVGNAQPHKNLKKLLEVFAILKKKYPDLSLVLSGPDNFFWDKISKACELALYKKESHIGGLPAGKADVIFTGFISDQDLVVLYKNAQAFIMPSLEEGFGIPILEAMACGCPVVSSKAGSLPEIGGDAAYYFDPNDEKDMIKKITQVLDNSELRKELIKKGNKRYKEFSWKDLAGKTLKMYTLK